MSCLDFRPAATTQGPLGSWTQLPQDHPPNGCPHLGQCCPKARDTLRSAGQCLDFPTCRSQVRPPCDPPDVQSTASVCSSVHLTEAQVWLLFCSSPQSADQPRCPGLWGMCLSGQKDTDKCHHLPAYILQSTQWIHSSKWRGRSIRNKDAACKGSSVNSASWKLRCIAQPRIPSRGGLGQHHPPRLLPLPPSTESSALSLLTDFGSGRGCRLSNV